MVRICITDGQLASRGSNYLIKIYTHVLIQRVVALDKTINAAAVVIAAGNNTYRGVTYVMT